VKILVSNDDGYMARGINALAQALSEIAEVILMAPDRNHSGASNSLTLHSPLRVHQVEKNRYFVNGTPSDCVHLALSGYLEDDPDLVVSGVNHGANLGDDVIYSGTVAAAMEGRFLGLPAIAVSLVGQHGQHFDAAARVACDLVQRLKDNPLPGDVILNVNVPDLPFNELWIGPAGPGQDAGPGTDFAAIERGAVAVTPLKVDMTQHESLPQLKEWLES
jgi:5'-nucleotidase